MKKLILLFCLFLSGNLFSKTAYLYDPGVSYMLQGRRIPQVSTDDNLIE